MQTPRPAPPPAARVPARLPPVVLAPDTSFAEIRALIVDTTGKITPAGRDLVLGCYSAAQVPDKTPMTDVLSQQRFAEARQKFSPA